MAWGDYDNDGDLDILLTGDDDTNHITKVYRNDACVSNTVPTAPTNLSQAVNGNSVTFSWDASTDTQTPSNGLTYNLMVGTTSNDIDVNSPMADVSNGYRRVVQLGGTNHSESWTLNDLPAGNYFWRVQAIDAAFAGSPFSAEGTFFIAPPLVFVANELIEINRNQTSDGDIHSNYGKIEFGSGAPGTHTGNLTAGDDILIASNNTIDGDATAGGNISVSGNSNITGSETEHATIDVIPLPNPSYSAGGPNKTARRNGSLTLAPGSYGKVKVETNAKLYLSAGDYYMNILDTDGSAKIYVEVSGGAVNINVVSELEFDPQVKVEVTGGGTDLVTFTTLQNFKVDIGAGAIIRGTLIAPRVEVHFDDNCKFKGALYADVITLDDNVKFQHHSSTAAFPKENEAEEEVISNQFSVISDYDLAQNYPNPFNPSTVISFQLPVNSEVSLAIYSLSGQLVKRLASGEFASGRHEMVWDATDDRGLRVASGMYLYVLKAGEFVAQRKLVLMK